MTAIATLWQTHAVSKVIWQSHDEIFRFFLENQFKTCLRKSISLTFDGNTMKTFR